MEVGEFLKSLGKTPPRPVYLFCPHRAPKAREATFEPLLALHAVSALVDNYVDPSLRDLVYHVYHGDDTDAGEVVSVAETLPFLASHRVVVVHDADEYESEKHGKPLHQYLESPCDSTILILIAPTIDRRLRLFRLCEKNGLVVECPELNASEAAAWVRTEAQARGKTLSSGAAKHLVERTGTRLSDVRNALNNVCDYIGNEHVIEIADIDAACADVAEEDVWKLTDAIAASNTTKAVAVLRDLLQSGKSVFEILGTITWLIKTAYLVATSNTANVKPFLIRKCKPLADKFGREKFPNAFAQCMNTEILLRSTGVDGNLAVELLVIKLSAPRQRARAS